MNWWYIWWTLLGLFVFFTTASSLLQQWYDFHIGEQIQLRTEDSSTNWKRGTLQLINNNGIQVDDFFIPWIRIIYIRRL